VHGRQLIGRAAPGVAQQSRRGDQHADTDAGHCACRVQAGAGALQAEDGLAQAGHTSGRGECAGADASALLSGA